MDSDQSGSADPAGDDPEGPIPRRTLLKGAGASLIATGLAGCNSVDEQRRYEAEPASLAPEAGDLGFEGERADRVEFTRTQEVGGNSLELTLINYAAVYSGDPIGVGVGATPAPRESGQDLNPVVRASFEDLLTGEVGAPIRRQVDMGVEGDVEWTQGPDEIDATAGELLGHEVKVRTFVGATDSEEAVLVHLTRARDGDDVVFVGSGQRRPYDPGSDRPILHPEEGVFLHEDVDEALDAFFPVLEHVIREEAPKLVTPGQAVDLDVENLEVVDWPVENLPGGYKQYSAELANGRVVGIEDPVRWQELESRAPYFGEDVSPSVGALDPDSIDQPPDKVSLRSDQTGLKQQGSRRTCVVHCIAGAMEAEFNRQGETLDLDEQYGQHINKMVVLTAKPDGGLTRSNVQAANDMSMSPGLLDGFENLMGTGGGGNLKYQLALHSTYGLTDGVMPYRARWNGSYENSNQSGDDPRYTWNDPSSATQKTLNDYNLADEETTIEVPGSMTYTPFPQEALEKARYRIKDYGYRGSAPSGSSWSTFVENKLANDRTEVMLSVRTNGCVNTNGVWTVPSNPGNCGLHCLSAVGYDRTGNQNVIVAKNSWNQYELLSYNYVDQMVTSAGWINAVEKRPADAFYPELFMGRWELNYDGLVGTLDVRRLPDFFDKSDLGGEADKRLGEFYDFNGDMYRVNGSISTSSNGGEMTFTIDFSNQYRTYDDMGGDTFTARLTRDSPRLMAGTYQTAGGDTAGFYASKDGTLGSTADSNWVSPSSMVGEWTVTSPVTEGSAEITSASTNGSLSGRYYYDGSYFVANSGTLDVATNQLTLGLPTGSGNWEFSGYLHENDRGTASGYVSSSGGNERFPAVLTRQGAAQASIQITQPSDGASLQRGAVSLAATVTVDGNTVGNPGVVWTVDGPYDPGGNGGTIIGRGANATGKLASGTHTIYATYTGGRVSTVDTVTVTVNSRQAPSVSISSPKDGGYKGIGEHDGVDGSPYADLNASGSATAADGTSLSGSDLQWTLREKGDSSWQSVGSGSATTIRLKDYHCSGTTYEIRLQATDATGNTGSEIITYTVNLFGC